MIRPLLTSQKPPISLEIVDFPPPLGPTTKGDCIYVAIVISGYDEFALAQKALRLGVSEYLTLALERAKQQLEQHMLYLHAKEMGRAVDPFDLLQGA